MNLSQILLLALIQGICELLPVSSSAHVIFAEKLMGIDPTAPETTLLLVMLHTGTTLAVIVYFWRSWRERYFGSSARFRTMLNEVVVATGLTGAVGLGLLVVIEKGILAGSQRTEIEHLFGNAYIIASGLAAVGVMIILSSRSSAADRQAPVFRTSWRDMDRHRAGVLPAVPGLLALGLDDFNRTVTRTDQAARRGIQLRARRSAYSAGDRTRGGSPASRERCARGRLVWTIRPEPGRDGVQLRGRRTGVALAIAVAGTRPLAFLWLLLLVCRRRCSRFHALYRMVSDDK